MRVNNNVHKTMADIESKKLKDRKNESIKDIAKIKVAIENNVECELINLHRELDCKYQSCIKGWGMSMCGYSERQGFDYSSLGVVSLRDNLKSMSSKINAFGKNLNILTTHSYINPIGPNINITNNNENANSVNLNLSFEQATKQIEEMTSLTQEQTEEIIAKIKELEIIIKSKGTTKSKWEKSKSVCKWILDRSWDVALVVLPLLLKINQ